MMVATTYITKNTIALPGMPMHASSTAPVPIEPTSKRFLLPFKSAILPKNGMSNASKSDATVVA